MEKPFTIKMNDLQKDIIKMLNDAQIPYYVMRTLLYDIIKEIEDSDGKEITNYINEMNKGDKNGNV